MLVYDVSSKASFDRVEGWLAEARKYADESHALMVGNKADLELREVHTDSSPPAHAHTHM